MADSAGARRAFVISVILAAIVIGPALAVATTSSGPPGPCQTLYGTQAYCVGSVPVTFWCHAPGPCPSDGEQVHIRGYMFGFFGFLMMTNDTAGLNVGIWAPNSSVEAPEYSFTFWSNPMGLSESWFSPDHLFFVSWPDVPAQPRIPMTVYAVCGVAAPLAGG
jgi:hypothetical protein